MGSLRFDGAARPVLARQRFVPSEAYAAARRGSLVVDRFASRRRFESWGAWAQDRIRVRGAFFGEGVRGGVHGPGRVCVGVLRARSHV